METMEELKTLIDSGFNLQLVVNAEDLKKFFYWWEEQKKITVPAKPEKYLTAQETAEKLGVDVSTLWRWDKSGYLKKIKVGRKIQYRESDVLKLMEGGVLHWMARGVHKQSKER